MKNKPLCKAVYDCNVFLQAAASPLSSAAACLRLAEEGAVLLYISEDILIEVSEVLHRPSIQKHFPDLNDETIGKFLSWIKSFAKFIKKVPAEFSNPRDVDDEIYINLAIKAEAAFIVSRDKDLLDLMNAYTSEAKEFRQRFRPLKVIEPLAFLIEIRNLESE